MTIRSSLPSFSFQWVHWAEPWEFCELVGYTWCVLLEREWKNTRKTDLGVFGIGVILLAKGKTVFLVSDHPLLSTLSFLQAYTYLPLWCAVSPGFSSSVCCCGGQQFVSLACHTWIATDHPACCPFTLLRYGLVRLLVRRAAG